MARCPELVAEGYLQIKRAIYVRGQVLNRLLVHLEIARVIVSGSTALRYVSAFNSAAHRYYLYGDGSMEPSPERRVLITVMTDDSCRFNFSCMPRRLS